MKLDGYQVEIGDAVYDLYLGDGKVKTLTPDDHIVVVFGSRMYTFDNRGVGQHGRRSLYWHNPILLIPMKDEANWALQQRMNRYITEALRPGQNEGLPCQ